MASFGTLSRLSAVLTLDVTRFMTNADLVGKKLMQLRGQAIAFGQGFSRTFTLAFALVGAGAIKVAADFDRLQAQLEAVTGGEGMVALRKQALELGRSTIFTATQIANLQLELSKLGFSAGETASTVEATSKIAAVFGGDLVKTGNTIAEATRQFSKENLTATRVADVMAVAFQKTALSTDNFGQAMKNVGSVANIANVPFVDTVALLGLLANAGQKGGIAGTRLKGVMIRLGKQFGVTGKELQLLTGGQLDFNQLIEIFRNRAGVAAAVISELGDEFDILKAQLNDSTGAAAAMASALGDRLFFSLERIKASTEAIGITIGEAFGPTLGNAANALERFADFLDGADKQSIRFVVTLGLVLAALPPLVFLLTSFASAVAAIIGPTGFVVAAITALITVVTASAVSMSGTVGVIRDVREHFRDLASDLRGRTQESMKGLSDNIRILNEEMDKVKGDDRLGTVQKIEATQKLMGEVEKLRAEFVRLEGLEVNQLEQSMDMFLKVLKRNSAEVGKLKSELKDLQDRRADLVAANAPLSNADAIAGIDARIPQIPLEIKLQEEEIQRFAEIVSDNFADVDLSLFSESQLQADATRIKKLIDQTNDQVALSSQRLRTPVANFFVDEGTKIRRDFAAIAGGIEALARGEGFQGIADSDAQVLAKYADELRTVANLNAEITEGTNLNLQLTEELAVVEAAIAEAQKDQRRIAEEAGRLALNFSAQFANERDAADAVEAFDKLRESLIATSSQFAVATGDADSVSTTLENLSSTALNLQDVLTAGDFGVDVLGENFRANQGTISDRLKASKELNKAFTEFAELQVAAGRFDLASIFIREAQAAEKLAKQLEFRKAIKGIRDTSDEAENLSSFLRSNDLIDQASFLQQEIGRLTQRVTAFQKQGIVDQQSIDDIKTLRAVLEELQKEIKEAKLTIELGLDDARLRTVQDDINKTIELIERDSTAAVEELQKAFDDLSEPARAVSDAFDIGDSGALLSAEELEKSLASLNEELKNTEEGTDEFKKLTATISELEAFNLILAATQTQLSLNADEAIRLGRELELMEKKASFNEAVDSLGEFGQQVSIGLVTPLESATQRLAVLKQLFLDAFNDPRLLEGSGLILSDLSDMIAETQAQVIEMERLANIQQFLTQQIDFIGEAFVSAAKDGKNFFEALKDGFLNTFYALLGKLITLISLFAVLNVLSGGAFMAKNGGQGFGNFLAQGFGFPTGGTQSASGVNTLLDFLEARNTSIEGTISGDNIVLANQRGTRAIDRTFG